jgi:hypothetical protein
MREIWYNNIIKMMVFEYLRDKKVQATIDMLLRTSRLPLRCPKTFDNFDFSRIGGRNADKLRSLSLCIVCLLITLTHRHSR